MAWSSRCSFFLKHIAENNLGQCTGFLAWPHCGNSLIKHILQNRAYWHSHTRFQLSKTHKRFDSELDGMPGLVMLDVYIISRLHKIFMWGTMLKQCCISLKHIHIRNYIMACMKCLVCFSVQIKNVDTNSGLQN